MAGEPESTVHRCRNTHRGVRGRDPGVRVIGPQLLLQPIVGLRELVGVHPDDAGNPSGRGIGRPGGQHGVHEFHRVRLQTAEAFRLQQAHQAGGLEPGGGVVGESSEFLVRGPVFREICGCGLDVFLDGGGGQSGRGGGEHGHGLLQFGIKLRIS